MHMEEHLLSVDHLGVTLGNTSVFHGVSFKVARGEVVAIIGPNGAGKTVLLKTLLGLVPHRGSFVWSPDARLAYVPQKIDADRHLPISTRNLLESKAHILKLEHKKITDATNAVGLSAESLRKPIGHLSGGQFQKALIAFALLGDPNVILFDEPTASLDELSKEHVYEVMHELQDSRGITFILVSHELSVVNQYANKVLCLNKENICFGRPEEALTPETLKKLYGAPQKFFHHMHLEDTHS